MSTWRIVKSVIYFMGIDRKLPQGGQLGILDMKQRIRNLCTLNGGKTYRGSNFFSSEYSMQSAWRGSANLNNGFGKSGYRL